jgi:hypothetical protein
MKYRQLVAIIFSLALVASTGAVALADTIRLRDGSVIRGQIIGYKDQQFTVLIGGTPQSHHDLLRGRRVHRVRQHGRDGKHRQSNGRQLSRCQRHDEHAARRHAIHSAQHPRAVHRYDCPAQHGRWCAGLLPDQVARALGQRGERLD